MLGHTVQSLLLSPRVQSKQHRSSWRSKEGANIAIIPDTVPGRHQFTQAHVDGLRSIWEKMLSYLFLLAGQSAFVLQYISAQLLLVSQSTLQPIPLQLLLPSIPTAFPGISGQSGSEKTFLRHAPIQKTSQCP